MYARPCLYSYICHTIIFRKAARCRTLSSWFRIAVNGSRFSIRIHIQHLAAEQVSRVLTRCRPCLRLTSTIQGGSFRTLQELKHTATGTLPQLTLPRGHVKSSAGNLKADELHSRSESGQSTTTRRAGGSLVENLWEAAHCDTSNKECGMCCRCCGNQTVG